MNQPNIEKTKVLDPNDIKKRQPKEDNSLRSKHNIQTATVSGISHSGEGVQQQMNEERQSLEQNQNPCVCETKQS